MQARSRDPKDEAMRKEITRQKAERQAAVLDQEADDDDVMEDVEMQGMFRKWGGLPRWSYEGEFLDVLDNAVFDQK